MDIDLDKYYMKKAIKMAKKAEGYTSPNPLVGAVVVKNDQIVGKGYHKRAGEAHAEVNALNEAGEKANGATLYVNLEPCCHQGKTPACSLKVINSGITRLVVAMEDPNPLVAGEGLNQLKDAGIEIIKGVLKEEAKKLNEVFIKHITKKVPFVYLKTAQTVDGFLATSNMDSRWVTNQKARIYGHKLRHKVDAILVGIGTVLNDNPRLTTRLEDKKGIDPIRVVLDSKLRIPLDSNILNLDSEKMTIIVCNKNHNKKRYNKLSMKENVEILIIESAEDNKIDLKKLLSDLYNKYSITSILVEGGGKVNYSFLQNGLIDKLYTFIAPKLLGGNDGISSFDGEGPKKMKDIYQLVNMEYKYLDDNLLGISDIEKR